MVVDAGRKQSAAFRTLSALFVAICLMSSRSASGAESRGSLRGVMPVPGLRIYIKPAAGSAQKGMWVSTNGRDFSADNLLQGSYTLIVHFANCCGFTQSASIRAGHVTRVQIDMSRYYEETFAAELARSSLTNLTIARDGSKWFVEYLGPFARIAHLDVDGHLHEFALPVLPVNSPVSSLTPRSDGSLWFADGKNLERITHKGELEIVATLPKRIDEFVTAPDGSIWTWSMQGSTVTRYSPMTRQMHTFELPPASPGEENARLSVTNGNVAWYTSLATNSIVRFSGDATTRIVLPWKCGPNWVQEWGDKLVFSCWSGTFGAGVVDAKDMRATPLAVHANTDGSVSFAAQLGGLVWLIDRRGSSLIGIASDGAQRSISLTPPLYAFNLIAANDRLWFVDSATYAIAAVSPSGEVTRYHIPEAHRDSETNMSPIDELVADSNGNVWFLIRKDFALYHITPDGRLIRTPIAFRPVEMLH
jgi:streptogramin lyase